MPNRQMEQLVQPLKWIGGKHYMAKQIISMMPRHVHYVEPYAGGLAVLLERNPLSGARPNCKNRSKRIDSKLNQKKGDYSNAK